MLEWFRKNRYVSGASNKVIGTLSTFSAGTSISVAVLGAINQLLTSPSNTLANAGVIITCVNQFFGWGLHSIERAHLYNEGEQLALDYHLNEELLPSSLIIAFLEAIQIGSLGLSLYPFSVSVSNIDGENKGPIFTQLVNVIAISILMSAQKKWQFIRAIEKIKQKIRDLAPGDLQHAAWFFRDMENIEEARHLTNTQLKAVASDAIMENLIKPGFLTAEEVLGLSEAHVELFGHKLYGMVLDYKDTILEKRKFVSHFLTMPEQSIHFSNLDILDIESSVRARKMSLELAIALEEYHINVIQKFGKLYVALLEYDSTGECFLNELKDFHVVALEQDASYYQAIIANRLKPQGFLAMSREDLGVTAHAQASSSHAPS